jgi:hypothetical protein
MKVVTHLCTRLTLGSGDKGDKVFDSSKKQAVSGYKVGCYFSLTGHVYRGFHNVLAFIISIIVSLHSFQPARYLGSSPILVIASGTAGCAVGARP